MLRHAATRWTLLVGANVLAFCVLGFYQSSSASPRGVDQNSPPFANSVEQRMQMVAELRKINQQLAEQNALLRSGKLKVEIVLPPNTR